jgi:hypothetical protein
MELCVYCGDPAVTNTTLPARSFATASRTYPSCFDCDQVILKDVIPLATIEERRAYVASVLNARVKFMAAAVPGGKENSLEPEIRVQPPVHLIRRLAFAEVVGRIAPPKPSPLV